MTIFAHACLTVRTEHGTHRVEGLVRKDLLPRGKTKLSPEDVAELMRTIADDQRIDGSEALAVLGIDACTRDDVHEVTVEIEGSSPLALQIDQANKASSRRAVRENLAGLTSVLDAEDDTPDVWRSLGDAAILSDDEQLVRSLRNLLVPTPGPRGEPTREGAPDAIMLRHVIERLRSSPTMGEHTLGLIEDILRNPGVRGTEAEITDRWRSLRATLQEHYSRGLSAVTTPEWIESKVYEFARHFESSGNAINLEQAARLLVLGCIEGIPSPRVRAVLDDVRARFEFTPSAAMQLDRFLAQTPRAEKKPWTTFIYMAADNDLETSAVTDINRLESRFGHVAEFMNIIVLVDGSNTYVGDSPAYNWSANTRLFSITSDPSEDGRAVRSHEIAVPNNTRLGELLRASRGDLNMADGEVLAAALDLVGKGFPSDHLFVDFWNHGDSWRGVAADDSSANDMLRLNELVSGLKRSPRKVDVVGFDACLMQNTSVTAAMREAGVDFMVASEEIEPVEGWNLQALLEKWGRLHGNNQLTPRTLANAVVETYDHETYSNIDLREMDRVIPAVDRLGAELMLMGGLRNPQIAALFETPDVDRYEWMNAETYARLVEIRANMPEYGGPVERSYDDADLVDAITLCYGIETMFPGTRLQSAARAARAAVERAVVLNRTGTNDDGHDYAFDSHGLSIYVPALAYDKDHARHAEWLERAPSWRRFLESVGHTIESVGHI
jgi:hypothetical protein